MTAMTAKMTAMTAKTTATTATTARTTARTTATTARLILLVKFFFAYLCYQPFFAIRRFYYKFILCHINKETTYFS